MSAFNISLKALEIDYPGIFETLVKISKIPNFSLDYLTDFTILTLLKETFLLYKSSSPNQKVFSLLDLQNIQNHISRINSGISKGIIYDKIDNFLKIINVPIVIVNNQELRYFPHKTNKKPINKMNKVNQYIENILCDESKEPKHIWNFQELLKNNLLKNYVSMFEYGTTDEKGISYLVDFHPPTRRNACRVPVSIVLSLLMKEFNSENDLIKVDGFISSNENGERKPVVEILIPCPLCKKHSIHLPFSKFCNFIEQIDPSQKDKIKSYDKFISDDQLHVVYLYNRIRQKTINPNILKYVCPNEECKYSKLPFLFEVSSQCKYCIKENVTSYHYMQCPGCKITASCPICNNLESDHIGEQQICPKKIRITKEEKVEARKNNNIFCPACDFVVHWESGCAHLTCPECKFHYCGNCEQHLGVNPETGSRYTHNCPNPGNADHLYREAIDNNHFIPEELREHDTNPAFGHSINKHYYYNHRNKQFKKIYTEKVINRKSVRKLFK